METLVLIVERDGPEMLARIAIMKALRGDTTNTTVPGQKVAKVLRIVPRSIRHQPMAMTRQERSRCRVFEVVEDAV